MKIICDLSISEAFQRTYGRSAVAFEELGGGRPGKLRENSEIICESHMLLENAIASGESEASLRGLCVFLTKKSAASLGCQLRPLENP